MLIVMHFSWITCSSKLCSVILWIWLLHNQLFMYFLKAWHVFHTCLNRQWYLNWRFHNRENVKFTFKVKYPAMKFEFNTRFAHVQQLLAMFVSRWGPYMMTTYIKGQPMTLQAKKYCCKQVTNETQKAN